MSQYANVRCLWFQGNGLGEMKGLSSLRELRTLYLHENAIEMLEGLESLVNLRVLNVSKNFIQRIEGLKNCKELETLNISHNNLGPDAKEALGELVELPALSTLDVQANRIEDGEGLLDILKDLKSLRVFYGQGNKFVKDLRYYRKRVISTCGDLRYLDDRPIFDEEARRVRAWNQVFSLTGDVDKANESEREEIANIRQDAKDEEHQRIRDFDDFIHNRKDNNLGQSQGDAGKKKASSVIRPISSSLSPQNNNGEENTTTQGFVAFFEFD